MEYYVGRDLVRGRRLVDLQFRALLRARGLLQSRVGSRKWTVLRRFRVSACVWKALKIDDSEIDNLITQTSHVETSKYKYSTNITYVIINNIIIKYGKTRQHSLFSSAHLTIIHPRC